MNATKNAVYSTPDEWTGIADAWEAVKPALDVSEVELWINAGVQIPIIRTLVLERGLTAADVSLIKQFLISGPLPTLEVAIAAIAVLKGMVSFGFEPDGEVRAQMLGIFFNTLSSSNVSLTLNAVP